MLKYGCHQAILFWRRRQSRAGQRGRRLPETYKRAFMQYQSVTSAGEAPVPNVWNPFDKLTHFKPSIICAVDGIIARLFAVTPGVRSGTDGAG